MKTTVLTLGLLLALVVGTVAVVDTGSGKPRPALAGRRRPRRRCLPGTRRDTSQPRCSGRLHQAQLRARTRRRSFAYEATPRASSSASSTPVPVEPVRCRAARRQLAHPGRRGRRRRSASRILAERPLLRPGHNAGKGVWYAPFVLRPRHLGEARVLVVLPTNTWQAYNFEDKDSWYFDASVHTVDLTRPYIDGGVPPHYHGYDRGFIRWLALHHEQTDFVSDDDLDTLPSASELARDYDLIVFSGHEEYVIGARVRPDPGLPQPGRQPRVPLGERLLLQGHQAGRPDDRPLALARPRPARGTAHRGRVRRLEPRRIPEPAVHRDRDAAGAVALPRDRAPRRHRLRRLRHRGRRARPELAAEHPCPRAHPQHLRSGRERRDDLLHDSEGRQGLLGRGDELRRLGALAGRLESCRTSGRS